MPVPAAFTFRLFQAFDSANEFFSRRFRLCSALFIANVFALSIVVDLRQKLWLDELYTLATAQQASLPEVIKATLEGCDGQPPLYAMLVHVIAPVVQNQSLATRLPATLGYCAMLLLLLAFCRRRFPPTYSWIAILLVAHSAGWTATEGRSYSLTLCCGAAALLCWQKAVEGAHRKIFLTLLAVALSFMVAFHYYAIFFVVPLFVAELVRWWRTKKLDILIVAAGCSGVLMLCLHYPLIAASRKFQLHYWSPATWRIVPEMYWSVLSQEAKYPMLVFLLFAVVFLFVSARYKTSKLKGLTLPEWVAAGFFLVMPLAVVVLSMFTTHVFVTRYVVWASMGIGVLVTALLYAAAPNRNAVGVTTLTLLLMMTFMGEAGQLPSGTPLKRSQAALQRLAVVPKISPPIIVADEQAFMELCFQDAQLCERMIYPFDPDLELRYMSENTGPLLMQALSHRSKLHIAPLDAVLAANPRFILLESAYKHYLAGHLMHAGYRVMPYSPDASLLYEVEVR